MWNSRCDGSSVHAFSSSGSQNEACGSSFKFSSSARSIFFGNTLNITLSYMNILSEASVLLIRKQNNTMNDFTRNQQQTIQIVANVCLQNDKNDKSLNRTGYNIVERPLWICTYCMINKSERVLKSKNVWCRDVKLCRGSWTSGRYHSRPRLHQRVKLFREDFDPSFRFGGHNFQG